MKAMLATSAAILAGGGFLWLGQDQFFADQGRIEGRDQGGSPRAEGVSIATLDAAALAGLTPVSACVAGVTPAEAANALIAVRDSEHRDMLASASSSLDVAFAELARLNEIVSGGGGSPEVMAEHAAAVTAVAQAQSAYDSAVGSLIQVITGEFGGETAALWTRTRANASVRVPIPYAVYNASPNDWNAIERAFRRYEAANAQDDEQLDQDSAAILQLVENDAGVIAAAARLDTGLAAMEAAFSGVE